MATRASFSRKARMPAFHLATDLDGTWLPAPGQLPRLRRLEASLLAQPGTVLTFATGRTFASALEAIARWGLHPPHHLVSDVGTALFHRTPEGGWTEDRIWAGQVAARWDSAAAQSLLVSGLPDGIQVQPGVAPLRRLALQWAAGPDIAEAGQRLHQACKAHGLEADILPSHGFYFDVLPPGIHKGAALSFLQTAWDLPRPLVGCGDSANDLGLFEVADHPILMQGGLEDHEAPPALIRRAHRTTLPGPQGIHEALIALGLLKEEEHAH